MTSLWTLATWLLMRDSGSLGRALVNICLTTCCLRPLCSFLTSVGGSTDAEGELALSISLSPSQSTAEMTPARVTTVIDNKK